MNPAATIAIYFEIVPRYEKADAELHIVDFGMEPNSGNPKIVVKLRNSGGRVAFLKRANLRLDNVKVTKDREREASEIVPVAYDWLISKEDLSRGRSAKSLSRRIDSNDVDVIEFQIAFEELRTTFNASATLYLEFNEKQVVKVGTIELSAGNVAGEIPMVKLPEMPAALPGLLGEDVPAYTITEVLRELTKREDRSAAGEVTEKLHHADSHVRVAALIYFSSVEYKAALSNIVGLLADPDVDVRDAAFHAVIRQGDDAVEPLLEMLEANDAVTRATAASLLGEVGSPRAESALIKSASDRGVYSITFGDEQLVAATALRALAKLQSAAAAPIVMDALNDTNASVKSAAISAARDLKLQTAVPKLLEIGNSSNARSRKAAKEALKRLGVEAP